MASESSVKKTTLDNGLRILTESISYVDSVSLGIWADTGSRNEEYAHRGVSHFLEHMLFKGTEKRSARQIADEMDMIGGHLNAFTDKEYTCYYTKVLSEHLPVGLDLLSDMVLNSLLDPEEIEREKNVVLEEIKRHEDTPEDQVHDIFAESVWHTHPLGRPVIGSRTTVSKLTREVLTGYMGTHYTPDRIVISAAGNLDHDKFVEMASKEFSKLQGKAPARKEHEIQRTRNTKTKTKNVEQVHFCLGAPAFSQHDDRKYTLAVIDSVLGGGMSSRLFQEIRENRGLAYAIGSYSASYRDTGLFAVYGGTSMSTLDEVLELVRIEIAKLKEHNATDIEIERGKNQIRGALILGQESTSNRMSRLAKSEIYFSRVIPLSEIVDRIMSVTKEDISEVTHLLFDEPELAYAAIGPFGKKGE